MFKALSILAIVAGFTLCGCGTEIFNEPLVTGISKIAPTGAEYEVIFTREVVNAHNAVTSVLSTFKRSAGLKDTKVEFTPVDVKVCETSIEKLRNARDVIEETLPANGWEHKREYFMETVDQIINGIHSGLDTGDMDITTLSKQEVMLASLATSDSGASQLQDEEAWHD